METKGNLYTFKSTEDKQKKYALGTGDSHSLIFSFHTFPISTPSLYMHLILKQQI